MENETPGIPFLQTVGISEEEQQTQQQQFALV